MTCKRCFCSSRLLFTQYSIHDNYVMSLKMYSNRAIGFYSYTAYCHNSYTNNYSQFHQDFAKPIENVNTNFNRYRLLSLKSGNYNLKQTAFHSTNSKHGKDIDEVKENIYTVPNLLTVSRIAVSPLIGYLIIQQSFPWALGLSALAGITDLLDGYIARNFKNQASNLGSAIDPLADKILVTTLTVTLSISNLLPVPLAILIIGRDVLLVLAGIYIRFSSLEAPKTLARFINPKNVTAKFMPSKLSKMNTGLQLSLVCLTLAAPVLDFMNHPALIALWFITGATTLGSGVDYALNMKKYVQYPDEDASRTK